MRWKPASDGPAEKELIAHELEATFSDIRPRGDLRGRDGSDRGRHGSTRRPVRPDNAAAHQAASSHARNHPTFMIRRIGTRANGSPQVTSATPTGLPPSAIQHVYNLSGLSPTSNAGSGQIIAIVDAFADPNALADLNVFNAQYGYAALSTCTSLTQAGACFEIDQPSGRPASNADWALEESLDIEWAHAEAPGAKIVLVEASSASNTALYTAVRAANSLGATEVSMSWGGGESSSETGNDSNFTRAGTFYTASAGDSGHGVIYPSASPNVIAVGGTTLNGWAGTSCAGFTSETTWSGSGGGISADEAIPAFQTNYTGPVSGAATIRALTGSKARRPRRLLRGQPEHRRLGVRQHRVRRPVRLVDARRHQRRRTQLGRHARGQQGRRQHRARGQHRGLRRRLQDQPARHHQRHERHLRH